MMETVLEKQIIDDFSIVPMTLDVLPSVYAIELSCYPKPWSYKSFVDEITQNEHAYYVVAQLGSRVVGYAGMWLILDEAHITNIAVASNYRRRKIGERLLVHLLEQCLGTGVSAVYLEVRRYNLPAQRLYARYLFRPEHVREKYYQDNEEDAVVLRIGDLRSKVFVERFSENRRVLREWCLEEQINE
ncbi:MAG: ribosomal protein S18-alanine N-acetyltransferase [bacterium]